MIVILRPGIPASEIERLTAMVCAAGYECEAACHLDEKLLAFQSPSGAPTTDLVARISASMWVATVVGPDSRYPRVSVAAKRTRTSVKAKELVIGAGQFGLIGGPCTVEDEDTLLKIARSVKASGATALRGGAYKPTTSPYSFRGGGETALAMLANVAKETGLAVVTEAVDVAHVESVARVADVIQIGARNMQNFEILRCAASTHLPILLKRGMGSTLEEWLCAAEYIADAGNEQIILCERGIRTYEPSTRATLDISSIPLAKQLTHLPIIADPSHASGNRSIVPAVGLAAVAAGADGLIIETHPFPESAIKDGAQTIDLDEFERLARKAADLRRLGLVAEVGLEPTTPRV